MTSLCVAYLALYAVGGLGSRGDLQHLLGNFEMVRDSFVGGLAVQPALPVLACAPPCLTTHWSISTLHFFPARPLATTE